ncbi:hypothetical protein D0416_02475 [Staphylococcus epidermidis]|nr:hypothetical protein F9B42_04615 [Staphylococcus epidermidis]DAS97153.1 MAG TPA: hypothetical protein [Caudoviricetes sp.]MBM0767052.1 hypothetical protein [Staphylococcus epidermidis]MBM0779758.1 hypothetical protein [Staphylococcus epidermidis]MBM0808582.1 hypothetical protein [Staphylococcus epidermidis]
MINNQRIVCDSLVILFLCQIQLATMKKLNSS